MSLWGPPGRLCTPGDASPTVLLPWWMGSSSVWVLLLGACQEEHSLFLL